MEEFGRMFKLYTELGKKEIEANEKLAWALEKVDTLQQDVDKLRKSWLSTIFMNLICDHYLNFF